MATPALQKARVELCVRLARVTVLGASMRPLANSASLRLCHARATKVSACAVSRRRRLGGPRPRAGSGHCARSSSPRPTAVTCHLPSAPPTPATCPPSPGPTAGTQGQGSPSLRPTRRQYREPTEIWALLSDTRVCAEGTDGGVSHRVLEKLLPKTSCTFTG